MSATVTKLRVKDEDFLVASMIERCPKTMMIRELLQNALEAAQSAPEGERRVEFSTVPVGGTPKLAIWNSGTGLTGPELYRMCDIAASIRKETGLDRNFGMGAKVASLPSNQNGMRYRSARKGTVQEVMIGKYEGVYGRLLRPGPDGQMREVIHVTESAAAEGRPLDREWTEVVLLGNAPEQNTAADPYNGHPRSPAHWLPDTIGHRFFRFPAGTEVVIGPGIARLAQPLTVVSLAERLARLEHYEAVKGPDGIVLHYAYDPALPRKEGVMLHESLGAVVHQNEMYAVARGNVWRREAPSFGIPFAARHVIVLVELPDDYPVQPEAYREFLRYRAGTQAQLRLMDYAGLVSRHIPGWLARLLADASPDALYLDEVREMMRAMLEEMEVQRRRPPPKPGMPGAAPPAPPAQPADPAAKAGPQAPPPAPVLETPPALFLLRDPAELADRELTHRAAAYYAETHQLHINLAYPAVPALAGRLLALAPATVDPEAASDAAQTIAERAMVLRVVRALAYGLAKRDQPKAWREAHLRALLSPESLTLAGDDIETGWPDAEQAMRTALLTLPPAPAEAGAEAPI
ncbi:ATP-binding protein [Pseudoroseomonas rhizosphaerae]|uniref:ATP-binding protein n=1 Tax=Teichococcus rhizosphaerae TaxID=1335062 RepID=A0A2C7AEQ9_9PROT|nr:ATP-binding protein [Pseudoroseomonas rhizosphaerae]PHK95616.1 ATP-binding protein [Pseudoroseomonas rhizosphaerae]